MKQDMHDDNGAIRSARASHDRALLASELSTAATHALLAKQYPQALGYYEEALACYVALERWSVAANLCLFISGMHRRLGNDAGAASAAYDAHHYRVRSDKDSSEPSESHG